MELALTRLSFSVFAFGVSLTFHRSARTCEGVFMALAHTLRDCDITPLSPTPNPTTTLRYLDPNTFSLSNTFLMEFRSLV